MSTSVQLSADDVSSFEKDITELLGALKQTIVGQDALIEELILGIFSGGHILIEGLPGLGKTHLAKALAKAMGLDLVRIQCTPDLMPADITGSEILTRHGNDRQHFEFVHGPIFANMVLVDEINRATPKTQAAFLEAMQERQVTYGGTTHPLPNPFWILATQNPIELEGTYPLPEAQLDRFTFMLKVDFPNHDALGMLIDKTLDDEPSDHIETILPLHRAVTMMSQAREVVIASPIKEAAIELALITQPALSGGNNPKNPIRYGASPRGLQAMLRAARVHALLHGRGHVSIEDLQRVALPSLRHRVLLSMESEIEGLDVDSLLKQVLSGWLARLK